MIRRVNPSPQPTRMSKAVGVPNSASGNVSEEQIAPTTNATTAVAGDKGANASPFDTDRNRHERLATRET